MTKQERPKPTAVCASCNKLGTRWHCASHMCSWVVCEPCGRIYERTLPSRWMTKASGAA